MVIEYVYALHDFEPQNDDEIAFVAGERIEVLEKDDAYGDGWWTGRNLAGHQGIFPKDYTTPAPAPDIRTPTNGVGFTGSTLHPLQEDDETESTTEGTMAATMTDIQQAIDQLKVSRAGDDGRSVSFISTREEDMDGRGSLYMEEEEMNADWHRETRRRLFETVDAMHPDEEQEPARMPLEVEFSDESDAEDEHGFHHHHHHHDAPPSDLLSRIQEATVNVEPATPEQEKSSINRPTTPVVVPPTPPPPVRVATPPIVSPDPITTSPQNTTVVAPHNINTETPVKAPDPAQVFSPTTSAFSAASSPTSPTTPNLGFSSHPFSNVEPVIQSQIYIPENSHTPTPAATAVASGFPTPTAGLVNGALLQRSITPTPTASTLSLSTQETATTSAPSVSKPNASSISSAHTAASFASAPAQSNTSFSSPPMVNAQLQPLSSNVSSFPSTPGSVLLNSPYSLQGTTKPSEWTVDQVIEWARSKGFDESICGKFREHEITGDVLLEFDVNMLKEIDIPAFGKRMKLANAIADLKRPASVVASPASGGYSSQAILMPQQTAFGQPQYPTQIGSFMNLNSHDSPVPSPSSFGHIRGDSDPGSLVQPGSGSSYGPSSGFPMNGNNPYGDRGYPPYMSPNFSGANGMSGASTIGPAVGARSKNRPNSLALSPSDGMLMNMGNRGVGTVPEEDQYAKDDRGVLSEPENSSPKGKRRKKDVKSLDSSATPPDTPGSSRSDTPSGRRPRSSQDTRSASDRLSFLSNAITGVGRTRKPAPRYSSDHSGGSDFSSPNISSKDKKAALAKIYQYQGTAIKPPVVAKQEPKPKEKEEPSKDGTVLRKRTLSDRASRSQADTSGDGLGAAITLKAGENVLAQLEKIVGAADREGWMHKKGERYNTWKNRYFFLKGPHLYYLRSKTETRIKGYINIRGYKVVADEATHPGKYGFRIVHDTQKSHFFSSEEHTNVREWMKSLMKATIDRDFARPVISSCNIPTIPLSVAQAMNPAPRPPSPTSIAAAQRASRRSDPNELSNREARILMGIADGSALIAAPVRPSREMRRPSLTTKSDTPGKGGPNAALLNWINSNLPDSSPQATDFSVSLSSGLILYRLAEAIKYGKDPNSAARSRAMSSTNTIVPDSLFDSSDEKVDGLMTLFDFLVDNDVKLSGVSIADVKEGRAEKIIGLVKAMKLWQERRDSIAKAVGVGGQASMATWVAA